MNIRFVLIILIFLSAGTVAVAQKIVYSEPDRDDSRKVNFEVVGKVGGNFLVYKNVRNKNYIVSYDNNMEQIEKGELEFVPSDERMINVDFFPYNDFAYMIYQYQRKNIVYCVAAKIGPDGKLIGDIMEMDTTQIRVAGSNKIYTVLTSEDKSRISIFKINSRDKKLYRMTSHLLDDKLNRLHTSRMNIPMEPRQEYLGDFSLDNEGDLVFCKFTRNSNDNISSASFVIKYALSDELYYTTLNLEKLWLDEIRIKVDNSNKRYILASFYMDERRGNIDGLYFYIWDKVTKIPVQEATNAFNDGLKKEARGEASVKAAFNDYFIKDIITRRDGGFIIATEAFYTTSRYNNWNRWDYIYSSPYSSRAYNDYYFSPYSSFWWRDRYGNNRQMRYHADNITVFSFNNAGQQEWNSVIGKSQYDEETADKISYQLMNTGSELRFLFNQQVKRTSLLTDFTVSPGGDLTRNPTLKNLDRGHEFMPVFGKQVSSRQMIIPCTYRNYICFAKVEYN